MYSLLSDSRKDVRVWSDVGLSEGCRCVWFCRVVGGRSWGSFQKLCTGKGNVIGTETKAKSLSNSYTSFVKVKVKQRRRELEMECRKS